MPHYTVWLYEGSGPERTYTRLFHSAHESGIARASSPNAPGQLWTHPPDWADPAAIEQAGRRLVAKGVVEAPDMVTLNEQVAANGLASPLGVLERAEFLLDMARATGLHDLAVEAGTHLSNARRRLRAVELLIDQIEKE